MAELTPHAASPSALARRLGTDLDAGLSRADAQERLERFGANRPEAAKRPPYLRIAAKQVSDPMVVLLVVAAAVAIAVGDTLEGAVIAAIVVLNGVLGFTQESRAERAIGALAEAFSQQALVVRGGEELVIGAEDVVPGDLVLIAEGDRVPADARIISATGLEADESALTGESMPVAKTPAAVAAATPLAERACMVYAGASVTRGRGRALVCATGAGTEVGRIAQLAASAPPPPTPLTQRLGRLARWMAFAGGAITVVLCGVMLLRGEPLHRAFLTGVAVAVAAVPEGLAATVTAALALGARAMARRGAIVRRLAAIETLGETTVICTDKTGTLTENRIVLAELLPAPGVDESALLEAAVLASGTPRGGEQLVGDPIEIALIRASGGAPSAGRLLHELPFDSERKRMTRVWEHDGGVRRAYTKGAPEILAARLGAAEHPLVGAAAERAAQGWRVLAVASRALGGDVPLDEEIDAEGGLLGIVSFEDPLRPAAAGSVAAARRAGIGVRMVTGDHPAAARSIGHALGLAEADILARATPRDKLDLVRRLQDEGQVVAVTGDGVNDAPALRRADVGVAMGRDGTEAARQASSIVLTDDDFDTIVAAIGEGRRIGDNIRRFVTFLLSANLGEVVAFMVAVGAGLGTPLSVVQVLVVNLLTDGLPAVALARDPADEATMSTPPRREAQLLGDSGMRLLLIVGVAVGGATLASFELGHAFGGGVAQTMAFATLALSELALVFAFRTEGVPIWHQPRNRWLTLSVLGSLVFVAAAVYVPAAHDPLDTVSLGVAQAAVALALALVPVVVAVFTRSPQRPR